jgi:hypothetical protein
MNPRVTLGFLAALVVVALVVFGLDRFNVGPTAGASATATSVAGQSLEIFKFEDSKVTAFQIRQGENSVRIEKAADSWTVAGSGEPANRSSFNSLMIRMSTLKGTRRVDDPGDLKEYGLAPAQESAVAELDDGTRYELEMGDKTPTGSGRYAKRSDAAEVYVISDQFGADLQRLVADPKEPPTPTPRPATPTPETTPTPAATGTPTP